MLRAVSSPEAERRGVPGRQIDSLGGLAEDPTRARAAPPKRREASRVSENGKRLEIERREEFVKNRAIVENGTSLKIGILRMGSLKLGGREERGSGMTQLIHAGAIPVRKIDDHWEFLLVTSRSGNWIFPKGICEFEEPPEVAALRECEEEAGVRGTILPEPVGSYDNERWGHPGTVLMFLLRFEGEVEWEESDIRRREWVDYNQAIGRIRKKELHDLLARAVERLEKLELEDAGS